MKQLIDVLLTRNEFRKSVFKRDGYKCIVCGEKAILDSNNEPINLDSHHTIKNIDVYIMNGNS